MPLLKHRNLLLILIPALASTTAVAQEQRAPAPKLSLPEIEEFLRTAKVLERKEASKGVTNSLKTLLESPDGKMRHYAHIQTINVSKAEFESSRGKELNFKDLYKYNVAAYELAKILGIESMIPPSVERKLFGQSAAVTWWVDDVMMDELERSRKKMQSPHAEAWNMQMYVVRVFDQLIYNTDRNLGNLLITNNWNIWMIDHTRAFRLQKTLPNSKNLVQCERKLLAKLRGLDRNTLKDKLKIYLTGMEIDGVLARAQLIVTFFDDQIKQRGEAAILYDLPPRT